ncbi:UDP-N-acetylmuramoyl-L-alanine--D-glutamate ligase [Odoribacter lunatus]|uniref:UDP-N-acetylmuramoyl-L-alanine--D-glutamate ligase n=1 Tax=Odoribacter lunatus TaxID=2941335 RepID=UPI00203DC7C7|nr:UDP-N-acetylmuramoyl-L-alanine--D-glutamate ligase [Odoribacter lunatus]
MKRLVVLGGKESGTGAALLGKKQGYDVFLSDMGRIEEKYKAILQKEKIVFEEGGHSVERILEADVVVKSPGIPDSAPLVVRLREKGVEVISEIEFAGRYTDSRMICITGSNGKTTTTLLIHHILTQAGVDAGLAGNVGKSLALQVAQDAHPVYVVELSSFQLDGMFRFKADVAVLTNITPDHLDRYDHKFENYVDSKFRILQNMDTSGLFIYGKDCDVVKERVEGMKLIPACAGFTYGTEVERNGAYMDGNHVVVQWENRRFSVDKADISIQGRHNVYNAMAAILACIRMGLTDEAIRLGLKSFPQVEHRLETVAVKGGITYINDSKATNVDSAWYALDSMTAPVVWIAGGTDKGNDYEVLLPLVKEKVKVLICMGVDNKKLINSFSPVCEVVDTHSLEETMIEARKRARQGDVVLLSPCCASFDLFKNYEQRGELFKKQVKAIPD